MKIIILADKYQKGTKSQGCSGLLRFNDSINVLQHQYNILSNNFKDAEIIYVYGFDAKKLHAFIDNHIFPRMTFVYNNSYDNYNECFSLEIIKNSIDSDTLILSGYTIFNQSFFKSFNRNCSQVFIDPNNGTKLGCIINNNRIENIFYDLNNKIHSIFYISSSDVDIFNQFITIKNKNAFLFEIINKCISKGCKFIPTTVSTKSIKYYKYDNKIKFYDKYQS